MVFSITIHYNLAEYLAIVNEVASFKIGRKAIDKWYWRLTIYVIGTPIFLFKSVREGKCYFIFSELGFERNSNSGTSKLKWESISKVVKLNCCYILVGKEDGMAPVPMRCLEKEQLVLLEQWAGNKLTYEL
ncbi:MAG: YcxB family protein [Paraglaciecola sp.]|uniref:YcxB family protein n=1 Tax=Paraglaciecola sp. TaxID=1920173 RepID=UPI003267913F